MSTEKKYPRDRLPKSKIEEVELMLRDGESVKDIMEKAGISYSSVKRIKDGKISSGGRTALPVAQSVRAEPKEEPKAAAPDNVNHPSHYETNGVECIVAMEAAQGVGAVQDFCICNAFKYIWRHKHKNGVEDIRKAVWYLTKWLELNGKREVLTNETD